MDIVVHFLRSFPQGFRSLMRLDQSDPSRLGVAASPTACRLGAQPNKGPWSLSTRLLAPDYLHRASGDGR